MKEKKKMIGKHYYRKSGKIHSRKNNILILKKNNEANSCSYLIVTTFVIICLHFLLQILIYKVLLILSDHTNFIENIHIFKRYCCYSINQYLKTTAKNY